MQASAAPRARNNKEYLAPLALISAVLIFYAPILSGRASFPSGDFNEHFVPFLTFQARELLSGRLPLWAPYTFSGHPFLADVQAAVFYPPSWLTVALGALKNDYFYALEVEAIAHVVAATLFVFFYVRRILERTFPAFVAALVFGYGGYLTSYPSQQLAILRADTWLPLLLLALEKAWAYVREQKKGAAARWFVTAGLALALAILAGHPQSALYILYVGVAYYLFLAVYSLKRGATPAVRAYALGGGVVMGLVALGLTAAQLLPSLEYWQLSVRARTDYAFVSLGFPLQALWQLLVPGSIGVMSPLYVGILPLLLGVVGLARPTARVWFWLGTGVVALLLSFGGHAFLFPLFYRFLPGWTLFRSQERAAFLVSLALAILAGHGVALLRADRPPRRLALGLGFVGLVLAIWFLIGWGLPGRVAFARSVLAQRLVVAALLLAASVLLLALPERIARLAGPRIPSSAWLAAMVVGLIWLDLFRANVGNNLTWVSARERTAPSPMALILEREAASTPESGRVWNDWGIAQDFGLVTEVESTWGASPLRVAIYEALKTTLPMERAWELLNVEYVLTWRRTLYMPGEIIYEERQATSTAYLHRLSGSNPRAWVVHQARVLPDAEALALLAEVDNNRQREVILAAAPADAEWEPWAGAGETVQVEPRSRPDGRVYQVEMRAAGLLVLSEVFYPGWEALVDGQPVPLLRANVALSAVLLPAGRHRVELRYRPASLRLGLLISGATGLVLAACALVSARRRMVKR